jgi:hypothetical protein
VLHLASCTAAVNSAFWQTDCGRDGALPVWYVRPAEDHNLDQF